MRTAATKAKRKELPKTKGWKVVCRHYVFCPGPRSACHIMHKLWEHLRTQRTRMSRDRNTNNQPPQGDHVEKEWMLASRIDLALLLKSISGWMTFTKLPSSDKTSLIRAMRGEAFFTMVEPDRHWGRERERERPCTACCSLPGDIGPSLALAVRVGPPRPK